jgi:hypothetical protein
MSSERAVNDLGELAGTSCGLQSGAWTCYPTVERLGGSHQVYSQGTFADLRGANFLFINNAGQAVGNYIASDYRTRVMFLKDPQTLVDIGDLGARFLVPRAMSNTGVVVGDAWFDQDGGGYRHQAFVYDSNSHQLQLIPHLVTPLPQFPSSVVGSTAIDVSDTGQILLHTSRQYADGSCSINATSTNECHYEIRRFDSVGIREETLPWEFTANSIVASGIFDRMRMNSSGSILGQEMIANYPYNDNPNYDPSIPMGSYSLGVVRSQGEMRRLDYGKLIGYPEHLVGQILDFNDSGQILARIQKLGGYTVVGGVHSPVWIEVHEVLLRPTCR